jgi:hypothetical protein
MSDAGLSADDWQAELLRSSARRALLLCGRQCGKSSTAAALALKVALLESPATVLLLSPTLRQSGELFRDKVLRCYQALGQPVPALRRPTQLSLELANGSRIISLPESEAGIRGYSGVSLLVIDEASRVSESLYAAVRPMISVSKGKLLALSTPFGKRGWFYEAWTGAGDWQRISVKATECPRIDPAFLAEEYEALGERWFRQEYMCSFEEMIGAVFRSRDIDAAFENDIKPLFPGA